MGGKGVPFSYDARGRRCRRPRERGGGAEKSAVSMKVLFSWGGDGMNLETLKWRVKKGVWGITK